MGSVEKGTIRHARRWPIGQQREKETDMSDLYPVANPRPWGASLTISTIVIIAYLAMSLYMA
jgi:hypothetical protein